MKTRGSSRNGSDVVVSAAKMKTVKLNVGGHLYEIPYSLLKQYPTTMLARLIDDHWTNEENKDKIHFIDRDGDRFRYILDFMRDLQVHLPLTVSKAAFELDLIFFGFNDLSEQGDIVDKNGTTTNNKTTTTTTTKTPVIHQGSFAEVSKVVATVESNMYEDLVTLDESIREREQEIEQLQHKKAAIKTAHNLYLRFVRSEQKSQIKVIFEGTKGTPNYDTNHDLLKAANAALKAKDFLKDRLLSTYGLILVEGSKSDIFMDPSCSFIVESSSTGKEGGGT